MFLDAYTKNKWLWFHILGGGLLAKLFLVWFTDQQSVLLAIALAWEVIEYMKDPIVEIYGETKRFLLDAIGDVSGALVMAIIVVI